MRLKYGNIERLGKDHYRVSFELPRGEDGKRRRKRKNVRGTRQEAQAVLVRMLAEHGYSPDASDMTVEEFYEAVYRPRMENLAPNTVKGYKAAWKRNVQPLFGHMVMAEVTAQDLERGLSTIDAPGTQRNAYKLLCRIFNLAYKRDYIRSNPVHKDIQLKQVPAYTPSVYTTDELAEWTQAIRGQKYEPGLLCCAYGGLRLEEAFALFWDDIAFEGAYAVLHVTKALVRVDGVSHDAPTKTPRSVRRVYVGGYAAKRLEELRKPGHRPLVENKDGERSAPNSISKNYKLWCERHGVKYIPIKNLRTTYATLLKEGGQTDGMISSSLGHSNLQTAHRRYAMTTDTALASNADLFAGIVEGGKEVEKPSHDGNTSSNVPKCSLIDFEQIKKVSGFNR